MSGSGGYRRLPGGSDHFSLQTDRQNCIIIYIIYHHHHNHWNFKINSHFAVWVHSDGERERGREVEEQGQEIKDGGR